MWGAGGVGVWVGACVHGCMGERPLLLGRSLVFGDRLQGAGCVDVFCPPDVVRGPPR
jgi:hypothetical protein